MKPLCGLNRTYKATVLTVYLATLYIRQFWRFQGRFQIFDMGVTLVTDGSLTRLGEVALANKYRLRKIWLVSPWISTSDEKADPLSLLIEAYRVRRCTIRLLTRPPHNFWHIEAVRLLPQHTNCETMFSAHLHAKLYILECDGFRYALLGSPNLTSRANTKNRELGVEFRTTCTTHSDQISAMISDLIVFAYD